MDEHMNKTTLLDNLQRGYAALETVLTPLNEDQMTRTGVNSDWSIKDILAHIATWQQVLVERLQAVTRGEKPTTLLDLDVTEEEIDRLNAQFYEENKARSLAEVLTDFRTSYQHIVEIVQALSDEDLTDLHRFAWMGGEPLWQLIPSETYKHYSDHRESIQEWLTKTRKA
jgi:hypothetical protein